MATVLFPRHFQEDEFLGETQLLQDIDNNINNFIKIDSVKEEKVRTFNKRQGLPKTLNLVFRYACVETDLYSSVIVPSSVLEF